MTESVELNVPVRVWTSALAGAAMPPRALSASTVVTAALARKGLVADTYGQY